MSIQIAIVDYGMGNLHSISKKLKKLEVNVIVTNDVQAIGKADKIILPGVGHFGKAMQSLRKMDLINTLNEQVLVSKKPILGICLGMQLMAKHSEEGDTEGLGWFDADVKRFEVKDTLKYKVPHTGWNQISHSKESRLMKDIPENSEFYFVHSFHFHAHLEQDVLNRTLFEYTFVSAVERDNIFGVQYHPEKSQDVGEQLFKNFVEL